MFSSRGRPIGVIIGIDIGLTCTGVAIYANQDARDARPSVLQQWPGTKDLVNKVPTRVGYKAGEIGFDSWGFECPELEKIGRGMGIKDMFKFYLDANFGARKFQRESEGAPKLENVKKWYRDFLTALCTHITQHLQDRLRIARSTPIEFIFSIPTAWKDNDELVQEFRKLVDDAGFGIAGNVIMELTEGEASAVFTAKLLGHNFQEGDAFMVCDAGGGTTDMCVLYVKRVQDEIVELENLAEPKALPVGSADIDDIFEAKAQDQLRAISGTTQQEIELLAHQITRSDFQALKTQFGTELMSLLRVTRLPIPNSLHRISLSRDELKAIFDSQIKKIVESIDAQIQYLEIYRSNLPLSYLFLAGGLGSSKYVQDEIVKHCKNLKVLFAPDPDDLPLAVCKGLVIDRLQLYSDQLPVIPIRSTNTSYGILCREVYTKKHSNQYHTKTQLDGKKYAENQIDWILFRDKSLRGESVTRSYTFLVDPSKLIESWGFTVVCSTLDTDHLPSSLDGKGAKVLCHVTSGSAANLRDGDVTEKRNGLIGKKSVYYQVRCELSARISPGKMEFTSRIAGQDEDRPQSFTVHWPPNSIRHGDDCVLIRSCNSG